MTDEMTDFATEFYGEAELRWYQVAARNETIEALRDSIKRILIVLPTGAGKTLTIAATLGTPELLDALGVVDRPLRVLFIAHKHRLLTQAERTFVEESNIELVFQSAFSDIPANVIENGWDITVIDEAHHEAMASIQYQLEHIGDFPIIGLTATPDRADGCLIKFEKIVNPISREQAVAEGYLAETELYTFVDTPKRDKTDILTSILSRYHDRMGQSMIFVRTKKEVATITAVLQKMGKRAVGVLSQSESELNDILDRFGRGEIQYIVNCNKINEGVDVKGCTDVVLGRTFGSYPQLNQVIGRAARPDSDCHVWELINPLSGANLDTTVIVGTPRKHELIYRRKGEWVEEQFDYTATPTAEFESRRVAHGSTSV